MARGMHPCVDDSAAANAAGAERGGHARPSRDGSSREARTGRRPRRGSVHTGLPRRTGSAGQAANAPGRVAVCQPLPPPLHRARSEGTPQRNHASLQFVTLSLPCFCNRERVSGRRTACLLRKRLPAGNKKRKAGLRKRGARARCCAARALLRSTCHLELNARRTTDVRPQIQCRHRAACGARTGSAAPVPNAGTPAP
eukprot:363309-Chlamydomonas_euryale.AAC.45